MRLQRSFKVQHFQDEDQDKKQTIITSWEYQPDERGVVPTVLHHEVTTMMIVVPFPDCIHSFSVSNNQICFKVVSQVLHGYHLSSLIYMGRFTVVPILVVVRVADCYSSCQVGWPNWPVYETENQKLLLHVCSYLDVMWREILRLVSTSCFCIVEC